MNTAYAAETTPTFHVLPARLSDHIIGTLDNLPADNTEVVPNNSFAAKVVAGFNTAKEQVGSFIAKNVLTREVAAVVGALGAIGGLSTTAAHAGIDQNGNILGGASIAPSLSGIVGTTQTLGYVGYQNSTFQWETIASNVRLTPTINGKVYISEVSLVAATARAGTLTQFPTSSATSFSFLEYTPGNIMDGRVIGFNTSSGLVASTTVTDTTINGLYGQTSDNRTLQLSLVTYKFSSSIQDMDAAGFFFNTDKAYSYAIAATPPTGTLNQTYLYNPNANLVTNGANVSRTQRSISGGPVLTFGINGESGIDVRVLPQQGGASSPEPASFPLLCLGDLPLKRWSIG